MELSSFNSCVVLGRTTHYICHIYLPALLHRSREFKLCQKAINILSAISSLMQKSCADSLEFLAPALAAVSDDYQTLRFNGSFRTYSPYKGPLSPTVNAAWEELIECRSPPYGSVQRTVLTSTVGLFSVSSETLRKIEAPEDPVEWPPESGGGYLAQLEISHQLHCLVQFSHHCFYTD